MYMAVIQSKYRWSSVKEYAARSTLRNQKLRRIQQPTVIYRERTTEWRLESKTKSNRVRPSCAQIMGIDYSLDIVRWNWRLIWLTKKISDSSVNVATVI